MNYHEETGTMFNDSMGKAAMEIMERGICLEEYIAQYYPD